MMDNIKKSHQIMLWIKKMLTFACVIKFQTIMKKILFSLIALMSVMTVQAQSLCATWRSMQPDIETAEDGSFSAQNLTYTFNEDGTYTFVDELTLSTQPSQTMALEIATIIEVKGTYKLEDTKLTLTPNMDTYKTELLNISMNGHVTDDPMMKANVEAMINDQDFKEQFAEVQEYTVNVGDAMMEMNDGESVANFVRFATIKD